MPPPRVNKIPRNEDSAKDKKGTLDIPLKFLDQDYQELKKNCIIKRERYVDDKFPSDSSSIDTNNELGLDMGQIKWLRPSKIVADPQLIVKGVSRFDYAQGSYLGDCWFLASVGALTFREDVMNQVMPADQSFGEEYAGIFHFRFWRFGKWIDVVIDDKLPTINGKLIFVHSKTSNEFWPALLEKAYAKVCGSYADMHAGLVSEALLDFTGGIHVRFEPAKASIDLWSLMDRAAKAKALMACGTFQGRTSENTVLPNGIVQGHAYSVTGVFKVTCKEKPVRLVRVLNPWGKGEWTGSWSDNSLLWNKVSEKEQSKCRSLVNDGEFWMSMEDFSKYFEDIDICCLSPDFLDSSSKCSWTSTCYNDSWVAGTTAGGCLNNKDSNMVLAQIQAISGTCEFNVYQMWAQSGPTLCCCLDSFWKNPQFRVRIEALDKECAANAQCPENILVSLMQNQEKRHRSDVSNYAIGFSVFAIPPEMKDKKLPDKFFNSKRPVADCGNFLITRHVMKFFKLEPGEYLIVPSTFNPNESAKFILSIFTKSESQKTNKKPQMTYV